MGLINKMVNVGVATIGLVVAPIDMAVEMPLFVKNIKEGNELKQVETQSKLVCVLTEKLALEMENLNSTTLEIGNYVVSFADENKQQNYEEIYDKAISELNKYKIFTSISKEQFVDYMLKNGNELENYLNSEQFKGRLSNLQSLLLDETKTPEENLYNIELSIKQDESFVSQQKMANANEFAIYLSLIILQSLGLFVSLGLVDLAVNKGSFGRKLLESAIMLLLGPITGQNICKELERKIENLN